METSLGDFAQDLPGSLDPPDVSQAPSPRFGQLIRQHDNSLHAQGSSSTQVPNNPIIQGCIKNPPSTEVLPNEIIYPVTTLPSLSITRQAMFSAGSLSHSSLELMLISLNLCLLRS